MYQSGDRMIVPVSYTVNDDRFERKKRRAWIAKLGGTDWDLSPDGKRGGGDVREDCRNAQAGTRNGVPRKTSPTNCGGKRRWRSKRINNGVAIPL